MQCFNDSFKARHSKKFILIFKRRFNSSWEKDDFISNGPAISNSRLTAVRSPRELNALAAVDHSIQSD